MWSFILREKDTKIVDGGYAETFATFDEGADYCTVLGLTDDFTIKEIVKAGHDHGKKVVVDLICVDNLEERCQKVVDLGIDMLAVLRYTPRLI